MNNITCPRCGSRRGGMEELIKRVDKLVLTALMGSKTAQITIQGRGPYSDGRAWTIVDIKVGDAVLRYEHPTLEGVPGYYKYGESVVTELEKKYKTEKLEEVHMRGYHSWKLRVEG